MRIEHEVPEDAAWAVVYITKEALTDPDWKQLLLFEVESTYKDLVMVIEGHQEIERLTGESQ